MKFPILAEIPAFVSWINNIQVQIISRFQKTIFRGSCGLTSRIKTQKSIRFEQNVWKCNLRKADALMRAIKTKFTKFVIRGLLIRNKCFCGNQFHGWKDGTSFLNFLLVHSGILNSNTHFCLELLAERLYIREIPYILWMCCLI
mgnify:CR=1 FL=1